MNVLLFTFFTITCFNQFFGQCQGYRSTVQLPKCEACERLVESFLKGIEQTEKTNFAGGNTDWEEKRLGSYSTSEVRFLEIQENLCKENETTMDQCQSLAERFEDDLERWWTEDRWEVPDLRSYLCVIKTKSCPRVTESGRHIRISPPDPMTKRKSSEPGPTDPTPKGPTPLVCPKGLRIFEGNCEDINECLFNPCRKDEICTNTQGSYHCRECHPNCAECYGFGPYECKEYKSFLQFLIGSWLALYKITMVWPSLFFSVIFIVLCANFVFKVPLLPIIFMFCFVLYFIIKMPGSNILFDNSPQQNV